MKERPILFSAPMVRAILDGRKTQTRRILKSDWEDKDDDGWPMCYDHYGRHNGDWYRQQCPYGKPGDRLWVRETWAWPGEEEFIYRADPGADELIKRWRSNPNFPQIKWRPSIHMLRRSSRITLHITNVRVERLQDINNEDARAEGVGSDDQKGPVDYYQQLWNDINGAGSWEANPFVWVIEFERLPFTDEDKQ